MCWRTVEAEGSGSGSSRHAGLAVGGLLRGALARAPRLLGVAQRVHEHDGVVRLEGLAVPRALAPVAEHLLDEELPPAAPARPLDLHAVSFCSVAKSSSSRSASSKGSTGLTNHASAPDHRASQASWRRSSRSTIAPG